MLKEISTHNRLLLPKLGFLAKGMSKLVIPIADQKATFIVLNQLKTNIPQGPMARQIAMTTPYVTPGGKAMHYSYSLRIWLTGRKSKAAAVLDEKGLRLVQRLKLNLRSHVLAPKAGIARLGSCGEPKRLVFKMKSHGLMLLKVQSICSLLVRGILLH
jgi:hypothetical protein